MWTGITISIAVACSIIHICVMRMKGAFKQGAFKSIVMTFGISMVSVSGVKLLVFAFASAPIISGTTTLDLTFGGLSLIGLSIWGVLTNILTTLDQNPNQEIKSFNTNGA